jgi:hypothetical protein
MQKIITTNKPTEITFEHLIGREIVAYRSRGGEGVCVLSRLNKGNIYGFVRLNNSTSHPSFVGEGWFNSVKIAASARQLYTFDSMDELISSIYNEKF